VWKGPWRWYTEQMLTCCVDVADVALNGIDYDDWLCLARCQGLAVSDSRAEVSNVDSFRAAVVSACATDNSILCVSYSRAAFNQSGDGHWSPIGAYVASSDQVLIMDVARFKHPPHWVPLPQLWEAMTRIDSSTQRSRGFATLSRSKHGGLTNSSILLTFGRRRLEQTQQYFTSEVAGLVSDASSAEEELWLAMRGLPPAVVALVQLRDPKNEAQGSPEATRLEAALATLKQTPVHRALTAAIAGPLQMRDGPLPAPVGACAALLLLASSVVGEEHLRSAFPQASPLLFPQGIAGEEGTDVSVVGMASSADGSFMEDLEAARSALADMMTRGTKKQAHSHDAGHKPTSDCSK